MKTKGVVEALNVSPKGFYEGFLLRTAKGIVQVNLPKEERSSGTPDPGDRVTVEVEAEDSHGEPEHRVFQLVRMVDRNGKKSDGHENGRIGFQEEVVRLNYALHGEVNGGILGTGDFLHLKPKGAREVGLAVGMKVEGWGKAKPMAGGHSVIEAEEVNGIPIHHHKAGKKHAHRH